MKRRTVFLTLLAIALGACVGPSPAPANSKSNGLPTYFVQSFRDSRVYRIDDQKTRTSCYVVDNVHTNLSDTISCVRR